MFCIVSLSKRWVFGGIYGIIDYVKTSTDETVSTRIELERSSTHEQLAGFMGFCFAIVVAFIYIVFPPMRFPQYRSTISPTSSNEVRGLTVDNGHYYT